MKTVRILSGGAAQGFVTALAPALEQAGIRIEGTFGAVGAMRDRLLGGEPADLMIVTAAGIRDLAGMGRVAGEEAADLGSVATAVAVPAGHPVPRIDDGDALCDALLAADAIFFPDPEKATAGIHFAAVLERLGIVDQVRERLRTFPNGATAMGALAGIRVGRPIGCTQITEILATAGLTPVGELPEGYGLATIYTAAPCTDAAEPEAAREVIRRLAGPEAASERARAGFGPAAS